MIEFISVTAKTPHGDQREYAFMGDLDTTEGQLRLSKFMVDCCDDCADYFDCPDDWDAEEWHNKTMAKWEAMDSQRTEFGYSNYGGVL